MLPCGAATLFRHTGHFPNAFKLVKGSLCGPLIALGFAALPTFSIASCVSGTKPANRDISAIYFRSEGTTEPVAVHRGDPVQRGACPVTVSLYVSPNDVDKSESPVCFKGSSGEVYSCCGATDSTTNDLPQVIFDRLLAVLKADHFYDIPASVQPTQSDNAAYYLIAVMRCGAQPHNESIHTAFIGRVRARVYFRRDLVLQG
jgi:hypothetical protein